MVRTFSALITLNQQSHLFPRIIVRKVSTSHARVVSNCVVRARIFVEIVKEREGGSAYCDCSICGKGVSRSMQERSEGHGFDDEAWATESVTTMYMTEMDVPEEAVTVRAPIYNRRHVTFLILFLTLVCLLLAVL